MLTTCGTTTQSMPSPRLQYEFRGGLGGRVASVRRTDESYEGAVSPPDDYSSALRRSAANEFGPPDAPRWAVHAER